MRADPGAVLRLHILANSDSEEISSSSCRCGTRWSPPPRDCSTAFRTKGKLWNAPGNSCLFWRKPPGRSSPTPDYDYDVEISLRNMYFTTRFYDGVNGGESVTLPAACTTPSALISARGRDATGGAWYFRRCAFPPLRNRLKHKAAPPGRCAGSEQREIVTKPDKYEVRFKIVELFEDLCHQISGWLGQPESTPA